MELPYTSEMMRMIFCMEVLHFKSVEEDLRTSASVFWGSPQHLFFSTVQRKTSSRGRYQRSSYLQYRGKPLRFALMQYKESPQRYSSLKYRRRPQEDSSGVHITKQYLRYLCIIDEEPRGLHLYSIQEEFRGLHLYSVDEYSLAQRKSPEVFISVVQRNTLEVFISIIQKQNS